MSSFWIAATITKIAIMKIIGMGMRNMYDSGEALYVVVTAVAGTVIKVVVELLTVVRVALVVYVITATGSMEKAILNVIASIIRVAKIPVP